jgi:hypothetical protein
MQPSQYVSGLNRITWEFSGPFKEAVNATYFQKVFYLSNSTLATDFI